MTHEERIEFIGEVVKHGIAYTMVIGFLGLCYIAVLGMVNLESPTVAGFMGTIIGAVAAKIEPTVVNYFGAKIIERRD